MRTHRKTLWLWRSLALAVCSLPASACVDALVGEVDICEYEGKSYKLNEKFSASDGCNTCTCKIDGDVACTELACDDAPVACDGKYGCPTDAGVNGPVLGCDSKLGCPTDAGVYPPPGCDPKLGCMPGEGATTYCNYFGSVYKPGESFAAWDGCNSCSCIAGVGIQCSDNVCYEPDGSVAPGTCDYAGKLYKPGEWFAASDNCNKCSCTETGAVSCSRYSCTFDAGGTTEVPDAGGASCGQFSCPSGKGSCNYSGKTYAVGEGFGRGDDCNKCLCVADGVVECSAASCTTPGCVIGNTTLVNYGDSITCEDGCNACACNPGGFSRTKQACPALPLASQCDPAQTALFPAPLAYQSMDVIAVTARCVNGQVNDYTLCFDDLAKTNDSEVLLYVVAGTSTRACSGSQRVFDLKNVREAYQALTGQMAGKLLLRGNDQSFVYQFGI
jgi:hypothetical protein